ncbi:MAG: AraC family transcriptional regulator [Clostridiales bacterium]|nr:AraC family transcriptional regulator [Clostridiales bacterium]
MTLTELLPLVEGALLTPPDQAAREVSRGYVCDLLSWVMARGTPGMAWVTVQTHLNVVAVASLHEMACILLPEGIRMEGAPLDKAREEGIAVIASPLTAYEICARMARAGLSA